MLYYCIIYSRRCQLEPAVTEAGISACARQSETVRLRIQSVAAEVKLQWLVSYFQFTHIRSNVFPSLTRINKGVRSLPTRSRCLFSCKTRTTKTKTKPKMAVEPSICASNDYDDGRRRLWLWPEQQQQQQQQQWQQLLVSLTLIDWA